VTGEPSDQLLEELARAKEVAAAAVARALEVEAELANTRAENSDLLARNALLELQAEKMRRALYGTRSERSERLIDQMELAFTELEETAAEDERLAQIAAAKTTTVQGFARKRTPRSFPDHLPRERVVVPAPEHCPCCGSGDLSKLGEDVTSTLEKMPARMKVIETVRERFSCRNCETITQPPAPFHVTPRGMFGPQLLASILFDKYGMHQPLNRQSDAYAREGIDLDVSTLADWVGACTATLDPEEPCTRMAILPFEGPRAG